MFEQALARNLDGEGLRLQMYYLAFLRGDSAQMEQQLVWGAGPSPILKRIMAGWRRREITRDARWTRQSVLTRRRRLHYGS